MLCPTHFGQSYAIWERWLTDYVPALNCRSNWQTPAEQHLMAGDLVWIVEESNPRGHFPNARIEELDTVPTAMHSPLSYARRPYRSSANSLSLNQHSQHLLPDQMKLPSKRKQIVYVLDEKLRNILDKHQDESSLIIVKFEGKKHIRKITVAFVSKSLSM